MNKLLILIYLSAILIISTNSYAHPGMDGNSLLKSPKDYPKIEIQGKDNPNDGGQNIIVSWKLIENKSHDLENSTIYIYRSTKKTGPFKKIFQTEFSTKMFKDSKVDKNQENLGISDNTDYYYYLHLFHHDFIIKSNICGPVISRAQLFHTGRTTTLITCIMFIGIIIYYLKKPKKRKDLYLRPIEGINAVDEAIGRSTELGKPVLYTLGFCDISDVATLASLSVLSYVAEKCAKFGTPLIVPNYDPVVMSVAQEVVKEAYIKADKLEEYKEENIYFLSQRYFTYAAAICGIMVREKPAANFFVGVFHAESLLLAETGASTGAIQIAGTDQVTQLPFFITACDYTLIGEELYAAGAYMSKNHILTGTLKAQDSIKAIIVMILGIGFLLSILEITDISTILKVKEVILTIFNVE